MVDVMGCVQVQLFPFLNVVLGAFVPVLNNQAFLLMCGLTTVFVFDMDTLTQVFYFFFLQFYACVCTHDRGN